MPNHAHLTDGGSASGWTCDRGFVATQGCCDAVEVPDNDYLDPDAYGAGWSCPRGYQARAGACIAIELPENAHLDRSGNSWRCDRSFRRSGQDCILGQ